MSPYHLVGGHTATRTLCWIRLDDPKAIPYGHAYYVGRRKTEPVYCPECLAEHEANEATKSAEPDPLIAHGVTRWVDDPPMSPTLFDGAA